MIKGPWRCLYVAALVLCLLASQVAGSGATRPDGHHEQKGGRTDMSDDAPIPLPSTGSEGLVALEWPEVLELASRFADTAMGPDAIRHLTWIGNRDTLMYEQTLLAEILAWSADYPISLVGAGPIGPMARDAAKGQVLRGDEFVVIATTLKKASELARNLPGELCPAWAERVSRWTIALPLITMIDKTFTADGEVKDDASPRLRELRRQRRVALGEIDRVLQELLRSEKWAPYLQDTVVTVRFGRRVVPIKHAFRNSVSGIVHDQSASGQTVFVEPLRIVERQNLVVTLEREERDEIERILAALSQEVGHHDADLIWIHDEITRLDRVLAIARYGVSTKAVIPIVETAQVLRLFKARHPLLAHSVPLSLELGADRRILIVTGPNTGGKTVTLKTVGLMVTMGMAGMMIPAGEGSTIPYTTRVFVDIGDEQSLEQNLSTFSSHVRRLLPMLDQTDSRTLCLIDELGAGTDPEEGAALAEAILERLSSRHTLVIATTHYSRLKLLGFERPEIVNAHVAFDLSTLEPTYQLVVGQPGSSHALNIAVRLGLDKTLAEHARSLMRVEGLALNEALSTVNGLEAELRLAREALDQERVQWEQERRQWHIEVARFEQQQQRERTGVRDFWQRELALMKTEMDRLMQEVRQQEGVERARAIENLRQHWRQQGDLPKPLKMKKSAVPSTKPSDVGDWVRIQGFTDLGQVVQVEGSMALIEVGSLRIRLALDELEAADAKPVEKPRRVRSTAESRRDGSIEVDVRGMNAEDAWETVDRFVDSAVLTGWPQVRIIHGKGTGVLRRVIGERLLQDPRVVSHRLGQAGEGGDGVTVAWLEEEP